MPSMCSTRWPVQTSTVPWSGSAGGHPISTSGGCSDWPAGSSSATPLRPEPSERTRRHAKLGSVGDRPRGRLRHAFWGACHGGRLQCARYLIERGADLNWIPPWQTLSPVDAAEREGADELVRWLRTRGAKSAVELTR